MKDVMPADASIDAAPLWIFAYGSLMWRPEFVFAERHRATLEGYHRALCIWSHHYRGTADVPGLVFGLAPGGCCTGVAFRIAEDDRAATLDLVRAREMMANVYREVTIPATLADGRSVAALTYAADECHTQYAGALERAAMLRAIRRATGVSGPNLDYVLNTQAHLFDLGVEDPDLVALCEALNGTP